MKMEQAREKETKQVLIRRLNNSLKTRIRDLNTN